MTDRALLPGEYAVLCLLALRPMHGYEMLSFLTGEGLDMVCPVEQSTLYTYLRNVESRGLVTWTEERVGLRPPRKTYELSDAGKELVDDWLRIPVERMREVRLEFLLKLYFLNVLDHGAVAQLLADQIRFCEGYLLMVKVHNRPEESSFRRLVAQSKSSAAESTLSWLQSYARELEVAAVH